MTWTQHGTAAGSRAGGARRRWEARQVPGPRRLRQLWVIGSIAVVADVVVAVVALTVFTSSPSHEQRPAAGPLRSQTGATVPGPEITAAVSWAGRELPHDARVVTDPAVRGAMAAQGFTAVHDLRTARREADLRAADYVVDTSTVTAAAGGDSAVARALAWSVPIAAFGSGAARVIVRQMSSVAPNRLAARRRTDRLTRRNSEPELLANPAVHATGSARLALRNGELDMRCATVLAVLADASKIDLLGVEVDPAEHAAGLPARRIEVRAGSSTRMLKVLAALPRSYRPSRQQQLPTGTDRLTWAIGPSR